jgi:DNA-binding response OmpR family regulator
MLSNHRVVRGGRPSRADNEAPSPSRADIRLDNREPVRLGTALLVGPSMTTNRWITSMADSAGYSVTTDGRFDSLWGPAARAADVIVVEARRQQHNAIMAAIEGAPVCARRRTILLTWQLHWDMIERALQLEIADFQSMPCRGDDLAARMRAASVRASSRDWLPDSLDPSAFPSTRMTSVVGMAAGRLTVRERALYRVLAAREGEVVTRADLLAAVWKKRQDAASSNIVDVYVRYLRVKLAAAGPEVQIETIKRVGYVLRRKSAGPES